MTDLTVNHSTTPERVNILGVNVSAINMTMALENIAGWVARREPHYVCATPAHVVMECQRDPAMRTIFNRSRMTIRRNGNRVITSMEIPPVCRMCLWT